MPDNVVYGELSVWISLERFEERLRWESQPTGRTRRLSVQKLLLMKEAYRSRLFTRLDHAGTAKNRDLHIAEPQFPQDFIRMLAQRRRAPSDFARRLR